MRTNRGLSHQKHIMGPWEFPDVNAGGWESPTVTPINVIFQLTSAWGPACVSQRVCCSLIWAGCCWELRVSCGCSWKCRLIHQWWNKTSHWCCRTRICSSSLHPDRRSKVTRVHTQCRVKQWFSVRPLPRLLRSRTTPGYCGRNPVCYWGLWGDHRQNNSHVQEKQ